MLDLQEPFKERCSTYGAPTVLSFLSAAFNCLVVILLCIPGNLLVILAVATDPYKKLRTPFNYLMANLALADLIVGTVFGPLAVAFTIKEGLNKEISSNEIVVTHVSFFISCTASALSLSSLAVERYLATSSPHTYRNKLTGKRILATLVCIWLVSITLPFLYLDVGLTKYSFIFANTSVIVALAITSFTYITMTRHLKRRKLRRASDNQRPTNTINETAIHWEHKVTKMFLVVMITLLSCYGPSTVLIYIMSFCDSCSCLTLHWLRDIQFHLVSTNSSLNFFCYALRSTRFRKAFAHILRIKRRVVIRR